NPRARLAANFAPACVAKTLKYTKYSCGFCALADTKFARQRAHVDFISASLTGKQIAKSDLRKQEERNA
ncbi:MAG: hypothetical protein IJU29_07860, partial [Oscillospiraceae bacterium]|nr:hypothetical protein [Oscillospiraceae bacterium]